MNRFRFLLMLAGTAFIWQAANAQESISFPARAADLEPNSYWSVREFSEGCCTLDLNVVRWNGTAWVGGDSNQSNSDDYTWNVPLYAPADGEIASCWRRFPDNPEPGTNLTDTDPRIFTGGNHVVIITDDGQAISINHFKDDTIPQELCPSNPAPALFPLNTDKEGDWRVAAYIDPGDRPRVTEGQFLGRVGNSGNSGGPHLHISISDVVGTDGEGREELSSSQPLPFRNVWAKNFVADEFTGSLDWWRERGVGFTGNADCDVNYVDSTKQECGFKFLHPSPFIRLANRSAGEVGFVETAFVAENQIVTGVKSGNGNLKLIAWSIAENGTFTRQGEATAGAIKAVQLASPAEGHVLAAVQQTDNKLKLIAYRVTEDGQLTRVADRLRGEMSALRIATVPDLRGGSDPSETVAVTTFWTESGDLKVIVWDLAVASNGDVTIDHLTEETAGPVSAVSVAGAKHFYGFYTAVRNGDGNLQVIPWQLANDSDSLTRRTDDDAGAIGPHVDVAALGSGVAVGMRDNSGNLRVITWDVSDTGNIVDRKEVEVAGPVFQTHMVAAPEGGSSSFATITRGESGNVWVIGWAADEDGAGLHRIGTSKTGLASGVSAAISLRDYSRMTSRGLMVTGLIQGDGTLKLTAWDTNLLQP